MRSVVAGRCAKRAHVHISGAESIALFRSSRGEAWNVMGHEFCNGDGRPCRRISRRDVQTSICKTGGSQARSPRTRPRACYFAEFAVNRSEYESLRSSGSTRSAGQRRPAASAHSALWTLKTRCSTLLGEAVTFVHAANRACSRRTAMYLPPLWSDGRCKVDHG
jgi:hypothetical protein